jgi:murein tripeptide amidase MpaA
MTVVHLIYQLVEHAEENADMLENTDWALIPVANPDGYAYSHSSKKVKN